MKRTLGGALLGALFVSIGAIWAGVVSLQFPWQVIPDFTDVEVEIALPEEARIVAVDRIALDCRARIYAEVPVEGKREHTAFDRVYRTDTVEMTAYGDVDTCVAGSSAQVLYKRDGTTEVIIPAESIIFVRPRVDAVASADTVRVNKGLIGKFTDVFPWVSDDLGLTPTAYSYAQQVIGSSECMEAAYAVTEEVLIEAYTEQFVANGANADELTVTIDGTPDFGPSVEASLGELDMSVTEGDIACMLSEDLAARQGDDNR